MEPERDAHIKTKKLKLGALKSIYEEQKMNSLTAIQHTTDDQKMFTEENEKVTIEDSNQGPPSHPLALKFFEKAVEIGV